MTERIAPRPGHIVDRSRPVTFSVDGKAVTGFVGDSIASAMAAARIRITGRSFKYHRPRGLFCMTGSCANCMVRVDGVPNQQACQTAVRPGLLVERQNGLPSVDFDLMRVIDDFSMFFPAGFYYKSFYRPRFLWPMVEPFIRRAAGIGKPPASTQALHTYSAKNLAPDVLVIGAGPAGMAAAIESRRQGAGTVLIETDDDVGGSLRSADILVHDDESASPETAMQVVSRLQHDLLTTGTDVLLKTTALGIFEDGLVAASGPNGLLRIRPTRLVVATGALEQPFIFANNDVPGVMLAAAVERLVRLYGVLPGRNAVVLAADDRAYVTASTLREAGAEVTVVDLRRLQNEHTPRAGKVLLGAHAVAADGRRHVKAIVVSTPQGRLRLACDLVVMAGQLVPAAGLLAQAGTKMRYDESLLTFVPDVLPDGVEAAGSVLGYRDPGRSLALGRLAGRRAAAGAGFGADPSRTEPLQHSSALRSPTEPYFVPPHDDRGKNFACMCMDVTTKEMAFAVSEGFDSIELLKRYTTNGMGPCQGKSCLANCVRLAAELTGRTVPETGVPTSRPPWRSVELGLLAACDFEPRRQSPLHDCHQDLNAVFVWAGEWKRPRQYASATDECRAVHERVGVIDVSTLGKFRICGPEAVQLLERLYPNRYADLKIGRIRYGAMLNDQGVIIDDGTVGRLRDDEYFVTTTTSGADAIDQWIKWWMADWRLAAQVVNISSELAAINIAGPRARDLMGRLTTSDVSKAALPYLSIGKANVCGVRAVILRIGFVGELSYEIHFPSAYAEHMWSSILDAGREFGISPFGLEAQRVLRLEKQHIIVGQDTDALTTPYGAGLDWMVKLEKTDFLGRAALSHDVSRGTQERLVGFTTDGRLAPAEGSAVLRDGAPVGRVCSSRWSDAVGSVIGLAWVPTAYAVDGHDITIRSADTTTNATVKLTPFYDPGGDRLRS